MQTVLSLPNATDRRGIKTAPTKKTVEAAVLPTYAATDLTEGSDLAQIAHLGQTYTLRITRAGKLILTK